MIASAFTRGLTELTGMGKGKEGQGRAGEAAVRGVAANKVAEDPGSGRVLHLQTSAFANETGLASKWASDWLQKCGGDYTKALLDFQVPHLCVGATPVH